MKYKQVATGTGRQPMMLPAPIMKVVREAKAEFEKKTGVGTTLQAFVVSLLEKGLAK